MGWHTEILDVKCKKCDELMVRTSLKSFWIDDHIDSCEVCEAGVAKEDLENSDNMAAKAEHRRDNYVHRSEDDDDDE